MLDTEMTTIDISEPVWAKSPSENLTVSRPSISQASKRRKKFAKKVVYTFRGWFFNHPF